MNTHAMSYYGAPLPIVERFTSVERRNARLQQLRAAGFVNLATYTRGEGPQTEIGIEINEPIGYDWLNRTVPLRTPGATPHERKLPRYGLWIAGGVAAFAVIGGAIYAFRR